MEQASFGPPANCLFGYPEELGNRVRPQRCKSVQQLMRGAVKNLRVHAGSNTAGDILKRDELLKGHQNLSGLVSNRHHSPLLCPKRLAKTGHRAYPTYASRMWGLRTVWLTSGDKPAAALASTDPRRMSEQLSKALAGLAAGLGLDTIAEGVQTPTQQPTGRVGNTAVTWPKEGGHWSKARVPPCGPECVAVDWGKSVESSTLLAEDSELMLGKARGEHSRGRAEIDRTLPIERYLLQ